MNPLQEQSAGLWWLPGREGDQVGGILRWPTDGANSLQLIGTFEALGSGALTEVRNYPLVLGLTEESGPITLLNCTAMGEKLQVPGYVSQRFRAFGGMLRGALIDSEAQLTFNRAYLELPHLVSWSRLSGLAFQIEETKGQGKKYGVQIRYDHPEKLTATAGDAEIRLSSGFQTKALGSQVASAVEEILSIAVELESPLALEELSRRFIGPIERLLMFALDRPIVASRTHLESPHVLRTAGGETAPITLEFVPPPSIVEKLDRAEKLLHVHDMLFELADYSGGWTTLLPRWLEVYHSLSTALSRYFGIMSAPSRFVEARFLNMAQVAEAIHRERFPDVSTDEPAVHEARMEAILKACPPEHREWLERQLAYSNEAKFRHRLKDLLGIVAPAVADLLPNKKSVGDFVESVIAARNHYTHPGGDKEVAAGAALYWLTERLGYVIRAFLLDELGFDADQSRSLLARNLRYQHLLGVEA